MDEPNFAPAPEPELFRAPGEHRRVGTGASGNSMQHDLAVHPERLGSTRVDMMQDKLYRLRSRRRVQRQRSSRLPQGDLPLGRRHSVTPSGPRRHRTRTRVWVPTPSRLRQTVPIWATLALRQPARSLRHRSHRRRGRPTPGISTNSKKAIYPAHPALRCSAAASGTRWRFQQPRRPARPEASGEQS